MPSNTDDYLTTRQIEWLSTDIAPVDTRPRLQEGGPGFAPLLATKLAIPPTNGALIPRPRLTAQLCHSMECSLTLLVAPAGYGKTTLLSEWARQQAQRVAWVLLDAGDNDPIQFWCYVATALERSRPGVGGQALAALFLESAQA